MEGNARNRGRWPIRVDDDTKRIIRAMASAKGIPADVLAGQLLAIAVSNNRGIVDELASTTPPPPTAKAKGKK